jgi:hypothetical protein
MSSSERLSNKPVVKLVLTLYEIANDTTAFASRRGGMWYSNHKTCLCVSYGVLLGGARASSPRFERDPSSAMVEYLAKFPEPPALIRMYRQEEGRFIT